MRFLKRVSERGTLTLPPEVREALEVQPGDIVEFEVIGVVRKNNKTVQETRVLRTEAIRTGGDI